MKKVIFFIGVLLVSQLSFSMTEVNNQSTWRKNFTQVNHEIIKKSLGFDPGVELVEDNNTDVVHQCPTIYFYGWLSSKNAHTAIQLYGNSNNIPGDKIIFDFQDASTWAKLPLWVSEKTGLKSIPILPPNILKSNLAQTGDILTGIVVLKALYDANIKEFALYGQSRGGGTLTSIIGFLNKANETNNAEELKKLNITQQDCSNILKAIKVVILDCPLKNVKTALTVHPWASLFPMLPLEKILLPKISCYNPNLKPPIAYLDDWPNNIPVLFHSQYNDNKVSNIDDQSFAKKLLDKNSELTYVIPGNDGGHNKGYVTISRIIHRINYLHGGSYIESLCTNSEQINKLNCTKDESLNEYYEAQKKNETFFTHYKKKLLLSTAVITLIIGSLTHYFQIIK